MRKHQTKIDGSSTKQVALQKYRCAEKQKKAEAEEIFHLKAN